MKRILLLLGIAASCFGQATPIDVQKLNDGTNTLTTNVAVGSGKSLTIYSGGSLILQPGATFSPSAGSIPWTAIGSTPTSAAGYGIANGAQLDTMAANGSAYYLNSSNQNAGTLPAARLPAFTGDATSSAGSSALTLATVNSNTGPWGSASSVPTFTVDGKGRITAASNTSISLPTTQLTGTLQAAQEPAHTGDATNTAGSLAMTVKAINGTSLSGLATGILYNTTATGVPAIAGYTGGSLSFSGGNLTLSGDSASPGNSYFYGTNGSGTKGWYALSSGTVTSVSVTTANGVSGSVSNPTTTPAITLTLGAITPTSVNGLTISTSTGTLTIANGKTHVVNNGITLSGTDGTTWTGPSTSATLARTDAAQSFTGVQTFGSAPTITPFSTAGVVTNNSSGVLASSTALSGLTYNGLTLTANATGFQIAGGTTSKTLVMGNSLTFSGTDGTTMSFPSTTATLARTDSAQTFTGVQTFNSNPTLAAMTVQGVVVNSSAGALTSAAQLPIAQGGTGTSSSTGSGSLVLQTSPSLVTPSLGAATGTSLLLTLGGTGNAMEARYNSSNEWSGFITNTSGQTYYVENVMWAGGQEEYSVSTPSAMRFGNPTGTAANIRLDVSSAGTAGNLVSWTNVFTATGATGAMTIAAAPTITPFSTAGVVTNNSSGLLATTATNGSGNVVLTTSPSLVTPSLGVATATSLNGLTISTTTGTYTLTNGKTEKIDNTLEFAGTDSTKMTFPSTNATIARTDAAQTFTGAQTFSSPPVLSSLTTNGTLVTTGGSGTTSVVAVTPTSNSTGFSIAGGTTSKTLQVDNTLELAGTDSTKMTFPGTNATIARTDAAQTFTGTQTFSSNPTFSAMTTAGIVTNNSSGVTASLTNASGVNSTLMGILGTSWSNSSTYYLGGDGAWHLLTGGGNVSNSGTPTSGQIGVWVSSTTIQGLGSYTSNATGFTIGGGTTAKTLTMNNTLSFSGTDSTTMTFPSASDTVVTLGATQTLTGKTLTSPTLTTPSLGVATATSINGLTITSSTGTLTIANGKTHVVNNSITLAGTDSTTMTFPGTSDTVVTLGATQTLTGKTLTSPTLTTPVLGTPSSGTLTSCTGLPISSGVSGLGTGVASALAIAPGSANGVVLVNGALGTPSSGSLGSCTGYTVANLSGLGSNVGTWLGTPSGANLAAALTSSLPVSKGGTGGTTAASALLGITPSTTTITESAGAATVTWTAGNSYYLALNANCTISFSGAQDGQIITIAILNTASNYTVTWPTIKWTGGVAPTMTTGAHYDVYTIWYNSTVGAYFGSYVQNF